MHQSLGPKKSVPLLTNNVECRLATKADGGQSDIVVWDGAQGKDGVLLNLVRWDGAQGGDGGWFGAGGRDGGRFSAWTKSNGGHLDAVKWDGA